MIAVATGACAGVVTTDPIPTRFRVVLPAQTFVPGLFSFAGPARQAAWIDARKIAQMGDLVADGERVVQPLW